MDAHLDLKASGGIMRHLENIVFLLHIDSCLSKTHFHIFQVQPVLMIFLNGHIVKKGLEEL